MVRAAPLLVVACVDAAPAGNTPPGLELWSLTTAEDTPVTGTLHAHDDDGDAVTIRVGPPGHGTATLAGDQVTYTPEPDYHGADSIPIEVSDGLDAIAVPIAVQVAPVNDPPTAGGDRLTTVEAMPLDVDAAELLANDRDVDGPALAVIAVGAGRACTVTLDGGAVHFVPAADFSGLAAFDYTISDGELTAVGEVVVEVTGRSRPPR